MAVNAKFRADFSAFYAEIQKTSPYLKNLGDETDKVARKFDAMTKGFTGEKIIRDAHLMVAALVETGNVTNLTTKELLKLGKQIDEASEVMRRRGIDIPEGFKHISAEAEKARKNIEDNANAAKGLSGKYGELLGSVTKLAGAFGLAFGASAIISGIKAQVSASVEYASAVKNLSTSTGVSISGLQRLAEVGANANVSMETLGSAVNVLQKQLDEPAAQAALARMGLNFAEIQKLSPEKQFFEIAAAVGSISDPIVKANTGADLFRGKWADIAPAITSDMQSVIDKTQVLSDAQVEALERLGNRWDQWVRDRKRNATEFLANIVLAFDQVETLSKNPRGLSPGLAVAEARQNIPLEIPKISGLVTIGGRERPSSLFSPGPIAPYLGPSPSKEAADVEAKAKAARAAEALWKAEDAASAALIKFAHSASAYGQYILNSGGRSASPGFRDFSGLGTGPVALPRGPREIESTPIGTGLGFGPGQVGPTRQLPGSSLFGGLNTAVPQSIIAAIQGGGNVAQSVAGTVGSKIGSNIVGKFGDAIKDNLGKTFGSAINAVLPGLGALAGPLVGFIGKIFGGSEESKKVSPLRDEFFKLQGGLETLNPKIQAATGSLKLVDEVFKAKTADQYNAAIQNITKALDAYNQKLAKAATDTQTLAMRFDRITQLTPDLEKALSSAFDATNVDDYLAALSGINGVLDEQAAKQERLEGLAQKYGLSLADLGPKFAQGEVDKHSKALLADWTDLSALGGNNVAILKGMAGEFSKLAQEAQTTGAEIPNSLREPLQKLTDMGLLVDGAGEKFKDLSGLKFGDTLETHLKDLKDALDRLSTVLDGLPGRIANVPKEIVFDARINKPDGFEPGAVDGAAMGGIVTRNGIQHFANGGKVLAFRPRGTDTVPAMLTPGEMVLTPSQQRAMSQARGGDVHIHISDSVVTNDASIRELARQITAAQSADFRLRRKVRAS